MEKVEKDILIVWDFIEVYCQQKHKEVSKAVSPETGRLLCPDCEALAVYAAQRRRHCPKNPKPQCKNCDIHCYRSDYRQKIREIMGFSGRYFVRKGKIHYLWHLFR